MPLLAALQCQSAIVSVGGQIPNGLSLPMHAAGVNIIGTQARLLHCLSPPFHRHFTLTALSLSFHCPFTAFSPRLCCIGRQADMIDNAEDRARFSDMCDQHGIDQVRSERHCPSLRFCCRSAKD